MDFNEMMQNVQNMTGRMQEMQQSMREQVVEGTAGGGMVKAKMNGAGDLLGLDIDSSLIDPEDPEFLADTIVAAVNAAKNKIEETRADQMRSMTGGLDLSQFGIDLKGLGL